MALITSYSTLQNVIGEWLARSDLSAAIPVMIQSWESKFYREPKNRAQWMETALEETIADGVIAVPDDYLELEYAYVDGSPASRLDRVSLNQLFGTYPRGDSTGLPRWIARQVDNFVFGPAPDDEYTIKGVYWARPTYLRDAANDAQEHHMILHGSDLCLYGSLLEAGVYLRNDNVLRMASQMYQDALSAYRQQAREERVSGSPIQEVLA